MVMRHLGGAVGHRTTPAALHLFELPPDIEQHIRDTTSAEKSPTDGEDLNDVDADDDGDSFIYSEDEVEVMGTN
jgi:hypothetical protein